MASASDIPSITESWISRHFALATGLEDSLYKITSARLRGTPAASKLESNRVKFSSARPEIFAGFLKNEIDPKDSGSNEVSSFPDAFSARLTGRSPNPAI